MINLNEIVVPSEEESENTTEQEKKQKNKSVPLVEVVEYPKDLDTRLLG